MKINKTKQYLNIVAKKGSKDDPEDTILRQKFETWNLIVCMFGKNFPHQTVIYWFFYLKKRGNKNSKNKNSKLSNLLFKNSKV